MSDAIEIVKEVTEAKLDRVGENLYCNGERVAYGRHFDDPERSISVEGLKTALNALEGEVTKAVVGFDEPVRVTDDEYMEDGIEICFPYSNRSTNISDVRDLIEATE
jgi:hypothetical protein